MDSVCLRIGGKALLNQRRSEWEIFEMEGPGAIPAFCLILEIAQGSKRNIIEDERYQWFIAYEMELRILCCVEEILKQKIRESVCNYQ